MRWECPNHDDIFIHVIDSLNVEKKKKINVTAENSTKLKFAPVWGKYVIDQHMQERKKRKLLTSQTGSRTTTSTLLDYSVNSSSTKVIFARKYKYGFTESA